MRFIVNDKRVIIYGFVIMQNHIHIIWQMQAGVKRENVQRDFLKHTAQEIQEDLIRNKSKDLTEYLVNAKDRRYPRLTGRAGILGTEFFVSGSIV
jgi:putative transposase